MRLMKLVLAFAALAAALPSENVKENGFEVKLREPEPGPKPEPHKDDVPILDARIDAHEKEGRTVNLSPRNNREGLLPRQCNSHSTCPCDSRARGLWCGYCTSPLDAIYECRSGDCLNWVYQCGAGGACCTYGYRISCANRQGPCGS
ncbi:hypothetical protein N656DRAFT_802952 [Canariomyces notabilis]|uniref:Uncharacterized protein n=1 Tax=Canariomyces notabilis TaxID=2074819 RepID=A0AAN6QCP1_9PEZI|nr:hypothetical protein N656DRAFT_802952 [Canariomyces arenarius]